MNSQQKVGKRDRLVSPFQIPGFKFIIRTLLIP